MYVYCTCMSSVYNLVFSSIGRQPTDLCHGQVSVGRACICPSIHAATFFKHLLWNYASNFDWTSQNWSCHGLHQNSFKEHDSDEHTGCHGKKVFKIFLSETIRLRATRFGMYLHLMGVYQIPWNWSKLTPPGGHKLYVGLNRENLKKYFF